VTQATAIRYATTGWHRDRSRKDLRTAVLAALDDIADTMPFPIRGVENEAFNTPFR
jgi:hypothetical protein